ncbi:hypothetical protein Y032_0014g2262 [Ancylostoma ceylanicum]|uniref:Uncharacterized protein n=1 Tax=Ancylostoma ceylanicum TaxID=53326 RepID=A0A016V994_9BILA|nr:hypothetical protein Y032_0014g2262 [Ancylostoma ceylanicum]
MVAGGAPSSTRPTELRRDHFREQLQATPPYLLQSPYLDNRAEFGDLRNVFFDSLGWFCTCSHCQLVDIPCLKWCKQLLLCWVCHHAMHLKLFWEGFSLYCQFIGLFDAVYPEGVANALNADISCRRCGLYCEHMGKHSDVYKMVVTNYVLLTACMTAKTSLMTSMTLLIWGAMLC